MQPEAKLVKRISAYLEGRGAWCFKVHGGDNPFQEVGIPDLICCFESRFIGLEVKLPGEKASARQKVVLKRINDAGGLSAVVTSVPEVERVLQRITRK